MDTFIMFTSNPKTGLNEITGVSNRMEQVEEFMSKDDSSCRAVEVFELNNFKELPSMAAQIFVLEMNEKRNY